MESTIVLRTIYLRKKRNKKKEIKRAALLLTLIAVLLSANWVYNKVTKVSSIVNKLEEVGYSRITATYINSEIRIQAKDPCNNWVIKTYE
jgi:hypothetical protein